MTQAPNTWRAHGAQPLARVLWRFRRELLATLAFSGLANLLMLAPTLYMLQLYDRVMLSQSEVTLLAASLLTLLFLGVVALSEWLRAQLLVRVGVRLDEALNTRVFHALFERALGRPTAHPADGLQHLAQLRQFLTGPGLLGLLDLPWTPVYVFVSWLLHPALGLLSLAFVLLFAALGGWGQRHQSPLLAQQQAGQQTLEGFVRAKRRHLDALASMGMLRGMRRQWLGLHQAHAACSHQLQRRSSSHEALHHFVQYTQQSLVLAAGAWLVIRGELSLGAMIAANVLMARALQPVQQLAASWKSHYPAREAWGALHALLTQQPERTAVSLARQPKGLLQLVGVSASVPKRSAPILQDIHALFQPGELTVLLGASGSGKSTLARCLLGLWPDMRGRVLLDGEPIGAWDRQELGPHLGFLPQDVQLLAGTVAENIARLGPLDPGAVVRAAQAAGIHELILRLPQGYDTALDDQAAGLSAGHRQRLGLARALYGEPAVVVLDEPNAHLDEAGELALSRAIDALRAAARTVVVITHRGRLIQAADRLVVLQQGRIQLQGPREQVLDQLAALRLTPSLTTSAAAAAMPP